MLLCCCVVVLLCFSFFFNPFFFFLLVWVVLEITSRFDFSLGFCTEKERKREFQHDAHTSGYTYIRAVQTKQPQEASNATLLLVFTSRKKDNDNDNDNNKLDKLDKKLQHKVLIMPDDFSHQRQQQP